MHISLSTQNTTKKEVSKWYIFLLYRNCCAESTDKYLKRKIKAKVRIPSNDVMHRSVCEIFGFREIATMQKKWTFEYKHRNPVIVTFKSFYFYYKHSFWT